MTRRPIRLLLAFCAVAALGAAAPAAALALDSEPGQVVVKFDRGSTASAAQVAGQRPTVLKVRSVKDALRGLRARPDVAYAVPNVKAKIAQASTTPGFIPNDQGHGGTGGWQQVQWNFAGPYGVNAPQAWQNTIDDGVPGGAGVVIAVLDTGVAYANRSPYVISPDFQARQFVRGYDFVDRDSFPFDRNGHGTHVAGTLAEATNNTVGLTGLAFGARLMPVRVLNSAGEGNATDIAAGVRFATKRGAKIINLSLEFDADVRAGDIPQLLDALRYARSRGVLVVAASGNEGRSSVAYPARARSVMSVGATTEHGCLAEFSNRGSGLGVVAPGGGADAQLPGDPNCNVDGRAGRNIYQETLLGRAVTAFGIPGSYEGTSMAVPHVAATAALVVATGVIGVNPSPTAIERRLETTARDLGKAGYDQRYGYGLIDAAAATASAPATPAPAPTPTPTPAPPAA